MPSAWNAELKTTPGWRSCPGQRDVLPRAKPAGASRDHHHHVVDRVVGIRPAVSGALRIRAQALAPFHDEQSHGVVEHRAVAFRGGGEPGDELGVYVYEPAVGGVELRLGALVLDLAMQAPYVVPR